MGRQRFGIVRLPLPAGAGDFGRQGRRLDEQTVGYVAEFRERGIAGKDTVYLPRFDRGDVFEIVNRVAVENGWGRTAGRGSGAVKAFKGCSRIRSGHMERPFLT